MLLPLAGALEALHAQPAAQVDALLDGLLRPGSLAGLPLTAQANLLLLLRAGPHRFTAAQRAALTSGLTQLAAAGAAYDPQHASLLQLLAEELDGCAAPPACPAFLYTPQPCFPWAPVRADAATAAALHKQQQQAARRALLQQQQQEAAAAAASPAAAPDSKRPGEAEPGGSAAKRQRQNAAPPSAHAAAAAAAVAAEAELDAAVAAVKAALGGGSPALTAVSPQLREALHVLLTHAAAGGAAGAEALQDAGLSSLEDDGTLLLLLAEAVTPTSSYACCAAAAAGLLLPRLRALDAPASRDLAAAVEHAGAALVGLTPLACIAACLGPLLSRPGLSKHQAELLSASLKAGLPPALLPDVLAAACAQAPDSSGGGGSGSNAASAWNEHTVAVLQAVLGTKPPLGAPAVAQLAGGAAAAAAGSAELSASPKWAKLMLTLAKQYPAEAAQAGAKVQLAAAAGACRSFMAKALAAAVAKL